MKSVIPMIFPLLLIVMTTLPTHSLKVECDFGFPYKWVIIGQVLTCTITGLNIPEGRENITEVTGALPMREDNDKNLKTFTFEDVKMVNVKESTVTQVPAGFEKFFPNLIGIRFGGVRLTSLTHDDLKVFPKLRYVDCWHNNIDMLPSDLFTSTPNVEYLYFGDNKIKFVGFNVLKPLINLTMAIFQRNVCIQQNAISRTDVQNLIDKLHVNCIPNDIVVDQKMCGDKMKKLVETSNNLQERLEAIVKTSQNNENSLSIVRHQNAQLNAEKLKLMEKNGILEKENQQLRNSNVSGGADIERELQELQDENIKLKGSARRSGWMLISVGFLIATFCFGGFAFFYFYKNSLFYQRSNDTERLTSNM